MSPSLAQRFEEQAVLLLGSEEKLPHPVTANHCPGTGEKPHGCCRAPPASSLPETSQYLAHRTLGPALSSTRAAEGSQAASKGAIGMHLES